MSAPRPVRERLAHSLRQLRDARAWSQEELAEKADLHRNQIGKIERQEINPSIELVDKLATSLGVSLGTLLD